MHWAFIVVSIIWGIAGFIEYKLAMEHAKAYAYEADYSAATYWMVASTVAATAFIVSLLIGN